MLKLLICEIIEMESDLVYKERIQGNHAEGFFIKDGHFT